MQASSLDKPKRSYCCNWKCFLLLAIIAFAAITNVILMNDVWRSEVVELTKFVRGECPTPVRFHSSSEPEPFERWEADLLLLAGGANIRPEKSVYFPSLITACCRDKIFQRTPPGFDTRNLTFLPIIDRTFADVVYRSANCEDKKREDLVGIVRRKVEDAGFVFKV
jgi:hypothetical protein